MNFAERLKSLRKERKLTQAQMAEYLEITLRNYQAYEGGVHYPVLPKLIRLADFFEVSLDYLVGRRDER